MQGKQKADTTFHARFPINSDIVPARIRSDRRIRHTRGGQLLSPDVTTRYRPYASAAQVCQSLRTDRALLPRLGQALAVRPFDSCPPSTVDHRGTHLGLPHSACVLPPRTSMRRLRMAMVNVNAEAYLPRRFAAGVGISSPSSDRNSSRSVAFVLPFRARSRAASSRAALAGDRRRYAVSRKLDSSSAGMSAISSCPRR